MQFVIFSESPERFMSNTKEDSHFYRVPLRHHMSCLSFWGTVWLYNTADEVCMGAEAISETVRDVIGDSKVSVKIRRTTYKR